jgi:hypothetical protein
VVLQKIQQGLGLETGRANVQVRDEHRAQTLTPKIIFVIVLIFIALVQRGLAMQGGQGCVHPCRVKTGLRSLEAQRMVQWA